MKGIDHSSPAHEDSLVVTDSNGVPNTKWLIPDLVRSFKYIGCKIGHCDKPPKKEKPAPEKATPPPPPKKEEEHKPEENKNNTSNGTEEEPK